MACTIAQAIRWVNESFLPAALSCARWAASSSTGEGAEAGGGGDRAALVHEAGEGGGGARGSARRRPGRRRAWPLSSSAASTSALVTRPRGAAAAQLFKVDPVARRPCGRRRAWRCRRRCRRGSASFFAGSSVGRRGCCAGGAVARLDTADHGAHGDGLIRLDQQLGDRAGHGRRQLRVDLVGGDLDQRVVLGDLVARLHEPLENGALGHRIAHLRDRHVDDLAARAKARRSPAARRQAARRPRSRPAPGPRSRSRRPWPGSW